MGKVESASKKELKYKIELSRATILKIEEDREALAVRASSDFDNADGPTRNYYISAIRNLNNWILQERKNIAKFENELEYRKNMDFVPSLDTVQMSDKKLKKAINKQEEKLHELKLKKESLNIEIDDCNAEDETFHDVTDNLESLKKKRKETKASIKKVKLRLKELRWEFSERSREDGEESLDDDLFLTDEEIEYYIWSKKEKEVKKEDLSSLLGGICSRFNIVDIVHDKKEAINSSLNGISSVLTDASEAFLKRDKEAPRFNLCDFIKQQEIAYDKIRKLREIGLLGERANTFVIRLSRKEISELAATNKPQIKNDNLKHSVGDAIIFATDDGKSVYSSPFIVTECVPAFIIDSVADTGDERIGFSYLKKIKIVEHIKNMEILTGN